jgi:hypothetical protein
MSIRFLEGTLRVPGKSRRRETFELKRLRRGTVLEKLRRRLLEINEVEYSQEHEGYN